MQKGMVDIKSGALPETESKIILNQGITQENLAENL